MAPKENNFSSPDSLYGDFVQRHNLLPTKFAKHEMTSIYWTVRSKLEIDNDLSNHVNELDKLDPLWGLLRSMLDRTFECVEGAIVGYVTGSPASSEIISRTAIESAINLLFVLVDERKGDHLTQYFAYYFDNEQREIDQWGKVASNLTDAAQKAHQIAIDGKRDGISKLHESTDFCLSQIGLPTTKGLHKNFRIFRKGSNCWGWK